MPCCKRLPFHIQGQPVSPSRRDIANQIGIEQNILDFGQVCIGDDSATNSKTLKLTIKNYSRTDPCDVSFRARSPEDERVFSPFDRWI